MRLYLFPITRTRNLVYCKRNIIPPPIKATSSEAAATGSLVKNNDARETTDASQPAKKPPLVERVTARANATWIKWEAEDRGWKKTVTGWGNQLFSRIPYPEWGLKSIPPLSKARRIEQVVLAKIPRDDSDAKRRASRKAVEVDVIYPARLLEQKNILGILKQLSGEKKGDYRKRIWWSIVAMPFTIPFMLVPVVPNLPFFYLVFRAWSYWRAQAGCTHIEHLISNDLINPRPSQFLQRVYDAAPVSKEKLEALQKEVKRLKEDSTEKDIDAAVENATLKLLGDVEPTETHPAEATDGLLYPKGHGKAIALSLDMPEVEVELERAYDQTNKALEKDSDTKKDS